MSDKFGPGIRHFECSNPECRMIFKEPTRDYTSFSISVCPQCSDTAECVGAEPRPEWPTDKFGNLLRDYKYE